MQNPPSSGSAPPRRNASPGNDALSLAIAPSDDEMPADDAIRTTLKGLSAPLGIFELAKRSDVGFLELSKTVRHLADLGVVKVSGQPGDESVQLIG